MVEKMPHFVSAGRLEARLPMREKLLGWFSWIDENRVRAAWIAVAVIALILIVRIVRPL
jgi:hypothetical protein